MSEIRAAYDRLVAAREKLGEEFSDSSLSATTGYEPNEQLVTAEKDATDELIRVLDEAGEIEARDALTAYAVSPDPMPTQEWATFEDVIRPLLG